MNPSAVGAVPFAVTVHLALTLVLLHLYFSMFREPLKVPSTVLITLYSEPHFIHTETLITSIFIVMAIL